MVSSEYYSVQRGNPASICIVLSIYVTELLTSADYFFYMIAWFEGHFLVKSPGYYYPLISVEKSYNNNFSFVETKLKDLD